MKRAEFSELTPKQLAFWYYFGPLFAWKIMHGYKACAGKNDRKKDMIRVERKIIATAHIQSLLILFFNGLFNSRL